MKNVPLVNLLLTGQIRDEQAFIEIISHLSRHKDAFSKIAFSTWTQEITNNRHVIKNIEDRFDVVDAGNLIPVSPIINRDIISLFAQFRQVSCGIDYFNDNNPVLRIRADDQNICKLDLTRIINELRDHWKSSDKIKTVVKAVSSQVPGFLDDRMYILSQFHISQLKKFSLWDFLAFHQRNMFPEFILYYPLLSGFSDDLDNMLLTDVRSIRYQGSKLTDIGRWLSKKQFINAIESYSTALESRVEFFYDVIPQDLHVTIGLTDYISNLDTEVGPVKIATARTAIQNLIVSFSQEEAKIYNSRSRSSYETIENKKIYIENQFARKQYLELINFYEIFKEELEYDPSVAKFVGISHFYVGNKQQTIVYLKGIFDRGFKDFILLFYLSAAAFESNDSKILTETLMEIVRLYSDHHQAADHVMNCLSGVDDVATMKSIAQTILARWPNENSFRDKFNHLAA